MHRATERLDALKGCLLYVGVLLGFPLGAIFVSPLGGSAFCGLGYIVAFVVAVLGWSVWEDRRTARPGYCVACGYDLRGSPSADGGSEPPTCGAEQPSHPAA